MAAVEDATTAGDDDDPYVTAAEEEGPQDGDLAPLASATFDFSSPATATNDGPLVEPSGDVPAIREVAPPPATTEGVVAASGDVPALGKAAPPLAAPKNMSSPDSDCGVIAPSRAGPLPEVAAKAPDTAKIGGSPTKTVVDQLDPGGVEEALSEEGEIEHQTPAPKQEGAPILASAPFDGTAVSELEVSAVQAPGKMPQVQGTEQAASMVEDVVAAMGQVRSYTGFLLHVCWGRLLAYRAVVHMSSLRGVPVRADSVHHTSSTPKHRRRSNSMASVIDTKRPESLTKH